MSLPSRRRRGLVAAVAAVALAGCSAGSDAPSSGTADDGAAGTTSLAVGLAAEPASLDFTTTDGAAIPEALLYNVYETLVKIDAESGEVVPLLAEDVAVSEDGRTYTFTLPEGVTFSNGDEFTAEDVKFSIERVQSEDWTVSLKEAMSVVESVEAPSPTEAVVTLAAPSNDWLYRMTTRIGAMFSETGVDDLANTPVGTGPYVLDTWTRGDSLTLTTRDDYWGEAPDVQEVTLRYFEDATAMNNALLSGGIDVIGTLQSPESLERFADDDRFTVVEGTTNGELVLSMNNARPPFDDVKVRQAVRHALDRQAVLDTTYAGYGELIGSMVPPTDPWYEDLTDVAPQDQARARALLAEAGATDLSVAFRIPNLPYAVTAAQVVESQLAEVGITAEIEVLEFPARWLDVVFKQHDYDLSLIAHVEPRDITAFADPEYYFGYDSPEFRAAVEQAATAPDEQQYVELMQQAARQLSEDAAADWLFVLPNLIVAEQDVEGLPVNRVSESFDLTAVSRA
jgi:peptide/nickel transport system substrate-binding protein